MVQGDSSIEGRNYHADYKFKIKQGEKADGSLQLKELTVAGDSSEGLVETSFGMVSDWYTIGKRKNLKIVSPFETGSEPKV